MEGENASKVIELVNEVASISDYRPPVKKQYCNLARRLKLLIPMFEEIRDMKDPIPEDTSKAVLAFKEALESARELLRFGSEGSKLYLVCFLLCIVLLFLCFCFLLSSIGSSDFHATLSSFSVCVIFLEFIFGF